MRLPFAYMLSEQHNASDGSSHWPWGVRHCLTHSRHVHFTAGVTRSLAKHTKSLEWNSCCSRISISATLKKPNKAGILHEDITNHQITRRLRRSLEGEWTPCRIFSCDQENPCSFSLGSGRWLRKSLLCLAKNAAFEDNEIALLMGTRHRRIVLFHGAGTLRNGCNFCKIHGRRRCAAIYQKRWGR